MIILRTKSPTFCSHCLLVWSSEFELFSKIVKFNEVLWVSLATTMFVLKNMTLIHVESWCWLYCRSLLRMFLASFFASGFYWQMAVFSSCKCHSDQCPILPSNMSCPTTSQPASLVDPKDLSMFTLSSVFPFQKQF